MFTQGDYQYDYPMTSELSIFNYVFVSLFASLKESFKFAIAANLFPGSVFVRKSKTLVLSRGTQS